MLNKKKLYTPQYEALVKNIMISHLGLTEGFLSGMPCIKNASGRAVLGSFDGGLVLKLLDSEAHAQVLAMPESVLFDSSGKGGPMKDWIVVTVKHKKSWNELSEVVFV